MTDAQKVLAMCKSFDTSKKFSLAYKGKPYLALQWQTEPGEHTGAQVEDLLAVACGRLYQLNKEVPCRENSLAITKIEEALMWLERRTQDRKDRGVEGTKEQ